MAAGELGGQRTLAVALAGGSRVAIAGERSFQINYDAPSVATDAKGDTAVTNTPTRVNITCSVDALYVNGNAAQDRLLALVRANTQCTLEILEGGSALKSATATITSLQIVHADKEAATYSAEFDVDGDFA